MKKFLFALVLCIVSTMGFSQSFDVVNPTNDTVFVGSIAQFAINPYDSNEIQLEPLNGAIVACPDYDQMYSIKLFTEQEFTNIILSNSFDSLTYTSELATVPFDEDSGYVFLKYSNSKYGYAVLLNNTWVLFCIQSDSTTNIIDYSNSIKIYPNPTSQSLNIDIETFKEALIYNNNGQLVKSTNERVINVKDLCRGTYILKVITNDNKVYNQKFIKQ